MLPNFLEARVLWVNSNSVLSIKIILLNIKIGESFSVDNALI